jgi:uncharacterized protein with FMN-binding domain
MRRVALAIVTTVTGLVLLLSFKTHGIAASPATVAVSTTGTGSSDTAAPSTKQKSTKQKSSAPRVTTRTVTGDAVNTRYGPVQVKVTVKNGRLTAVTAVEYPNTDPRDAQINGYAIPNLTQEALSASSAQINTISGATFTSEGYITSLQSALDKVS